MSNSDYPSSINNNSNTKSKNKSFSGWGFLKKFIKSNNKANDSNANYLNASSNSAENTDTSEQYLFNNILALRHKKARDIMTARANILAFANSTPLNDIVVQSQVKGYSRLPIYSGNLDNIVGFIHIKDLIFSNKENTIFNINKILRKVIFISPYMRVLDLLYEMRMQKCQLAIVVDEFGGVDGLVSLEDVMEEIVGDITDEHDAKPEILIRKVSETTLEVESTALIEEIEKYIGTFALEEEKEEFDTIGGLIVSLIGYIPSVNQVINHSSGLEFKVLNADAIKLKKVLINYEKLNK